MMRTIPAALLALALAVPATAPVTAPAMAEEADDPVVAVVDGIEVYRSELLAEARELPEQLRGVPLQMIYEPLLGQLVDGRLLAREAERQGLADGAEVQRALERARARVLREAMVRRTVEDGVTDEMVRTRYDELSDDPDLTREEVRARHILLDTEEEALAVIDELEAGADFAELAALRSTGPSGPEGGDLGFFRREQMVAPFAEAAFAMEPGSVSLSPVETQFGWHVIKVEERREAPPAFEELEPQLRQEIARQVYQALIDELREGADIALFDLQGEPLEQAPLEEAPLEETPLEETEEPAAQ
jgi:peptidyl-prolyl cis-trans isomerase C